MEWQNFLEKHKEEAVIRVGAEDIPNGGLHSVCIVRFNTEDFVHDKDTLFKELFEKAQFGEHFGFNWDALIDCLTESDYAGAKFVVYIFYHYACFKHDAKEDFEAFLDSFQFARERTLNIVPYDLKLLLVDDLIAGGGSE